MLPVYLLLRGHNLPGGGFVAGLTMAPAIILQYMAGGTRWAEDRLRDPPAALDGASGCCSAAAHRRRLLAVRRIRSSPRTPRHLQLPLLGELHLPSALLFDLGVFSLVVGATALMLIALAHQSTRRASAVGKALMEIIVALGIGVLAGSGVWLLLRPRTFQVIVGLSLLSYAVNLFIFVMGWVRGGRRRSSRRRMRRIPRASPTRCRRRWCSRPS